MAHGVPQLDEEAVVPRCRDGDGQYGVLLHADAAAAPSRLLAGDLQGHVRRLPDDEGDPGSIRAGALLIADGQILHRGHFLTGLFAVVLDVPPQSTDSA